jgi:hypothetical protein
MRQNKVKKTNFLFMAATAALLVQAVAPQMSFASVDCGPVKNVDQLVIVLDQMNQDEARLQKIRTGIEELKSQLSNNMIKRVVLYTGTAATPVAILFTAVKGFAETFERGGSFPKGINRALGVEIVAEAGLIYLDIQNAQARGALKEKLASAMEHLKEEQQDLDSRKEILSICRQELTR